MNVFLIKSGFQRMEADSCIYVRPQRDEASQCNKYSVVALYVNDLIIASSNIQMCKDLEKGFKKIYHIKILGEIKHILCMDVEIDPVTHVVHVSQAEYIRKTVLSMDLMVNLSYTRHRWTVGNHSTRLRVQKRVRRKCDGCSHYHIVN
jgi:Reverse transcriptase (RNA-dependent DNA polymerase)